MLGYGFSGSFAAAIVWLVIEGALNGTVSIVRCVTAELNPEKSHRARALTLLPLFTNAGHLLGPLVGGFLASPNGGKTSDSFISKYPYAAPNIFIAAFQVAVALSVIFVLDETLESARWHDRNIIQRIWSLCKGEVSKKTLHRSANSATEDEHESAPLLDDLEDIEPLQRLESPDPNRSRRRAGLPFRKMWTFNVISMMAAHFLISGHMGTFPNLWAIFLSAPVESAKDQQPPFRLYGGLGMDPRGVGTAMSLQGLIGVLLQVSLYPTLNDKFGTIRLWRTALFIFPIVYFLAPFCALVAFYTRDQSSTATRDASGQAILWTAVLFILFLYMAGRTGVSPATTLLINDCTPHPSVRGTIHSTGTIVSSLSRSIFPAIALGIFGHGLRIGLSGLGFWFVSGLAALACVASLWVEDGSNCVDVASDEEAERLMSSPDNGARYGTENDAPDPSGPPK
jgi:hypothetical protein